MNTANAAALDRPTPVAAGRRGWVAASAAIVAVVLLPVLGLAYFAARGSGPLWPHLLENVLPVAVRNTVLLLAGVGVVVSVVGVGTAWLVATCRFPGRRFLEWALLLPLSVPTYIVAYSYLDVMHPVGPVQTWLRGVLGIADPRGLWFPEIRSMSGCIVVLGFVLYPYVYLPTRALFLMESAAMIEAARSLGAGRASAFFRVALPLSRPAVAAGISLALLEALNDVGAASFLSVNTLTVSIYTTWLTRSSIEGAAQIALVMLLVVLLLIGLERWARRRRSYSAGGQAPRAAEPTPLAPGRALAAVAACALPIVIGFVVPSVHLGYEAWRRIEGFGVPAELARWAANSVALAAAATLAAVTLGMVLAYSGRLVKSAPMPALLRLSGIGYAIPGSVLAVGLLVPMASLDNALDSWTRAAFGVSTGLLLTGSGAALVLAYVLRFLAIATGSTEAGLAKIDPAIDLSARSLGAGLATTMRRIHVPLLRPALLAGALLVFVDCMKELPATLLLRPFDFESLATHVYGEAIRGTYEDGAIAALAIIAVSLVPVVVLSWLNRRRPAPADAASTAPALRVRNGAPTSSARRDGAPPPKTMDRTARGKQIVIEGLTKSYGRVGVLRDVSIAIGPGEFCTFLGESGSGKTTLLRTLAGFEPFERGRILIDGRDMRGVPVERRNIGMVFQHYALFPHMTVARNVAFGLEMRRRPRAEIAAKVAEALALVDLAGFGERLPGELSGGQQQRVALARALAVDPDILVMDEPLGALDWALRQTIQLELKRLHRALGLTVVYVTHDREEALHLSDRIAIMHGGTIVQEGPPREVYARPRNAFVAGFLGECNIFRDDQGREFAVRPECVAIARAAPGAAGVRTGTVEAVMFLGSGVKVVARCDAGPVVAIIGDPRAGDGLRPGDAVTYSFDPAAVHRFG